MSIEKHMNKIIRIGSKDFDLNKRTYIMGILNVTSDSFSDGGKYNSVENAVMHAKEMVTQGADIIDIGGESTRPGHIEITQEEEIKRVIPVIKALKEEINVPISIDTSKAKVAELAIWEGATIINDIWGFKRDSLMAGVAAKHNVVCCLMHNRKDNSYKDFWKDILGDLQDSVDIALKAGVKPERIILDPGVGFAKTYEQNLIAMNGLERMKCLGYPILLGTSRKSVIGNTLNLPVDQRVEGTIATTVIGIIKGCNFIRVHDVLENKRACIMADAIIKS